MIDFRCTQCGRLLRTPDDAAGKQAQCPSCGAIQPVPTVAAPAANASLQQELSPLTTPAAFPQQTASNPYAGTSYDQATLGTVETGPIVPSRIDPGEVLSKSWQIAKPQIVWLFLFGLVYLIISYGAGFGLQIAMEMLKLATDLRGPAADALGTIAVQFVSQLVGIFLSLGAIIYMLKMARGQAPSLLDLLGGFPYLLRGVVIFILLGLICGAIAIPCMVPAILAGAAIDFESPITIGLMIGGALLWILALMIVVLIFGQCFYLLVDRNAGVFEAISLSRQITAGNRLVLFVLYLLGAAFAVIGVCAFCLPYLFAIGFGFLMLSVAYLGMTGQPTAADTAPIGGASPGAGRVGIGGSGAPGMPV